MAAVFWGALAGQPILTAVRWNPKDAVIGVGASVPLFAFFVWSLKTRVPVFFRHRHVLNSLLPQMFGSWSTMQLLIISISAGICEEALFRGAIQGSLADRIDWRLALLLASAAFGISHPITRTYAIISGVIGAYLGLLWTWSDNLLTPIITHAVYDFAALVYFLRFHRCID